MVYVFLADGFEETEAIAPIDLLRRAGLNVRTAAVGNSLTVTGSHGITVTADILIEDLGYDDMEAVVLPGGQPGTDNLGKSDAVRAAVRAAYEKGSVIGAICAAPSVPGKMGLLEGRRATCYPGYEDELKGALTTDLNVVTDGKIVTAKSAGYALLFGHALIEALAGKEKADAVTQAVMCS